MVEFGKLTDEEWAALVAGEHEPFGPVGAGLEWRAKDRHVGLRGTRGRLVAVAGLVIAGVEVACAGRFEVVGLGSLLVNQSLRGRGLMARLVEPLLKLAQGMGPDFAMIFCRPELVGVYEHLDFREIHAPVWAEQGRGPVKMTLPAMWRALSAGAAWPPGRVDVHGLPF